MIKIKILTRFFKIRDLKISGCYNSGRAFFNLLIKSGVLENLRHLDVKYYLTPELELVKSTCSFKHLETLSILEKTLKWQDVAQVFQHCPKLSQLTLYAPRVAGDEFKTYENQIRSGIRKLDCIILLASESNSLSRKTRLYALSRDVEIMFG
jgi:hypothetical protein